MWTLEQVRAEYHRLDRLLGIDPDFKPQPPEPRTESYYKKRPCPEMVFCAASILETYLEQDPE